MKLYRGVKSHSFPQTVLRNSHLQFPLQRSFCLFVSSLQVAMPRTWSRSWIRYKLCSQIRPAEPVHGLPLNPADSCPPWRPWLSSWREAPEPAPLGPVRLLLTQPAHWVLNSTVGSIWSWRSCRVWTGRSTQTCSCCNPTSLSSGWPSRSESGVPPDLLEATHCLPGRSVTGTTH